MRLNQTIQECYRNSIDDHNRFRSWEHCFGYFQETRRESLSIDRHQAALQLGFYLASWGMYRGSSFLLQHAYTAHLGVIDVLARPDVAKLWDSEFGADETDEALIETILGTIENIRDSYRSVSSRQPTDILITKILLGTVGCLPACDRYFINGFKSQKFSYSRVNRGFIEDVFRFCRRNLVLLRKEQERIETNSNIRYPLMKLIDMYFWQVGFRLNPRVRSQDR